MANSKKKCKFCKTFQPVEDGLQLAAGFYCSMNHAVEFSVEHREKGRETRLKAKVRDRKQAVKAKKKVYAKKKRDFYDQDVKTRKKAAKTACHLFIRTRDKDKMCICCGRPLGKNYDAGHWLESGNYSFIRYHEDNIHAQSVHCNHHKGGDSGDYEARLRAKIGNQRVDSLLANKDRVIKRTADDYKQIENYYTRKYKALIVDKS